MNPRALKHIITALLFLAVAGCGYSREGLQSPPALRSRLYIELFANDTSRAFTNDILTVQVIERFSRSQLFTIVENPYDAEIILGGEIVQYKTNPIAYNQYDAISAYNLDVGVRATARRPGAAREVVWRNMLTKNQDYTSNNQDLAFQQCAERLADDLYSQVTDTLFWGGIKEGR